MVIIKFYEIGANRGLGLGLVQTFLNKNEYRVIASCRDPPQARELQTLKSQNIDRLLILPLEVDKIRSHQELRSLLVNQHHVDSIDILIGNAGVMFTTGLLLTSEEEMITCFQTNVIGNLFLIQTFLDLVLASQAKLICFVSSSLGSIQQNDTSNYAAYNVSKAAVNMLASNLAASEFSAGGKVLCLHPGWVQTEMGGDHAPLTVTESTHGMVDVINAIVNTQIKEDTSSSAEYEDLNRQLSKENIAFVSYKGELLPW